MASLQLHLRKQICSSLLKLDPTVGDWQAVFPADAENREHHPYHMNTDERTLLPELPSNLAAKLTT